MSLFGNKSSSQKEESKENPTHGGGGLFGNQQAQPPATGGGLFGNPQAQPQTGGTGGGLFGNRNTEPPTTGGGLFGNQQAQPQTVGTGGGLFGNRNKNTEPPTTGGGLFGNQQAQPPTTGGGLFANTRPQPQSEVQQIPAQPLNVYELQGNAPYNPKPSASKARGEGTTKFVGSNFRKNMENLVVHSISSVREYSTKCLDELRVEDYELIRSGELPEDLQSKIIEQREKLGLPAPPFITGGKGYTKVFKSQTRNASMKSFFLSNKYSDVTFKVGDESIPVHRNILGQCSQHFDALFSKHESNTIPIVIEIHDAQPEAFKAIIEFLYCGEVRLHEELAADLLIVAPKFDLNDLATGAEDFLNKVINVENYLRMLETSDRIGSKSLRKKIFTFIIRNMKAISKREDFEELPRPLLMELLENAIIA